MASILIVLGLVLVAAPFLVALRAKAWTGRHQNLFNAIGVLGLAGFVLAGLATLYLLTAGTCQHAEVSWIKSGTEFVSQRSLNSMKDRELWLDETTGSKLAQGSSDAASVKAFDRIGSFARNLAPLTEDERKRVEEYADGFLRSSACD
jgi:hypothetical protein